MKTDKMRAMVALADKTKPRIGRPPKFPKGERRLCQVMLPDDLRVAAEAMQERRKLPDFADAVRELMREAAEARGLIEPRK